MNDEFDPPQSLPPGESQPQKRRMMDLFSAKVRSLFDKIQSTNKTEKKSNTSLTIVEGQPEQNTIPSDTEEGARHQLESKLVESIEVGNPAQSNSTSLEIPEVQPEDSLVHPDIEEGARHQLEDKLVNSIQIGSPAGIEMAIKAIAEAYRQAQLAAGVGFELTEEGKKEIPRRVAELCTQHMSAGLHSIFESAAFGASEGIIYNIQKGPERVEALFKIADELGVNLTYHIPQEGVVPSETALVPVISDKDAALHHVQEVIDRHLPQGIKGQIDSLAYLVASGRLNELPKREAQIEEWIQLMEQRGYKVVDHETHNPVEGEAQPAILPREVNKAEVRKLIDQAVKENISKGVKDLVSTVEY
ncbi:MAG: hypothetical protein ABIO02_02585, partial [Patescibacteria group bacterium]